MISSFAASPSPPNLPLSCLPKEQRNSSVCNFDFCALFFELCKFAGKVYAVDVTSEITRTITTPENFELILSDGCSVLLPNKSVDVAFSDLLMEHLYPDEALEQLEEIRRALVLWKIRLYHPKPDHRLA